MEKILLSIVIPTKNRCSLLEMALESITNQRADQNKYEVIVIDNGSEDNTKKVVQKYRQKIKNCRYIYDERPGLHVGRNRGLLESAGEYIGYLDDDVILFPNWINTVLEAFADPEVVCVGGSVIPYDMSLITKDFLNKYGIEIGSYHVVYAISCFWEKGISENDTRVHSEKPGTLFGGNSIYRKYVLYECEGFHPDGMPKHLLMYRGDGETYVEKYILNHKLKTMYYAQVSVYHMINTERVSNEYIKYMFFRNGISAMYTSLRENSMKGGLRLLRNTCKRLHTMRREQLDYICGEFYLLLYYIFYKRVRNWVHKKNYF